MAKKNILVSFDYESDLYDKNRLLAWDKNSNIDFSFSDKTPSEINSDNVSVIKANLTKKIKDATGILVIVGKYCDTRHKNSALIGYKNWQIFEIETAKFYNKKLIAVKLDSQNTSPTEMLGCGFKWAMSFTLDAINKAVTEAYE